MAEIDPSIYNPPTEAEIQAEILNDPDNIDSPTTQSSSSSSSYSGVVNEPFDGSTLDGIQTEPLIEQNGNLEGIGTLNDMVKETSISDSHLASASDLNAQDDDDNSHDPQLNHNYNLLSTCTDEYQQLLQQHQNPYNRTFMTGMHMDSNTDIHNFTPTDPQQQSQPSSQQQQEISTEELMILVEKQMLEHERGARYIEAEKSRQHLENLRKRYKDARRTHLESIQAEDVRVFFSMVQQHQDNFDRTWSHKTLQHKERADDLINSLKKKHEREQRELYETLRRKRLAKFSVELLNMRKRQVLLAKCKRYIAAEKLKRKADMLESIEIEKIRESAREENQCRFQSLLKKQEWERAQLAIKLKLEKRCLLEAKAQDFIRLKKRLRNAEQELKKTHVRQQLMADKKLSPLYTAATTGNVNANTNNKSSGEKSSSGGENNNRSALRQAGRGVMSSGAIRRSESNNSSGGKTTMTARAPHRSAREIALSGHRSYFEEKSEDDTYDSNNDKSQISAS